MKDLTVGRIVHFVMDVGRHKGDHRPAIVVRNWEQENGLVQLQVFTDGANDDIKDTIAVHCSETNTAHSIHVTANTFWRTSVLYSETKEPGTWHWPERA